ncbi:MAG: SDR family oxidoreductase [Chitinophagaceae bacterium]|nr:SDR family oxidoreductase [Chitinophagaceae bacterium]
MKIFITGANGFLGQHLSLYLAAKGFDIITSGRGDCKIPDKEKFIYKQLELTNKKEVLETINELKPHVIIHTAAMSKPDECERQRDVCLLNNVTATSYLVDAANAVDGKFIYVSTDFVFGEGGPHNEDDFLAPLNFYGESKLMAEELVKKKAKHYAIMRPVFIYGKIWEGMRPTFLHWVKNNLEQNKPIKVVSDQQRTPTYVIDLCKGIEAMIDKNVTGIYHLAGKEILSPYQMAVQVAAILNLDKTLIESVTSETFPEPVKRAKKSGLVIDKARKELGYEPVCFEEGVRRSFNL